MKENNATYGWHLQGSYISLPERFYTHLGATDFVAPETLLYNRTLATTLGLDEVLSQMDAPSRSAVLCGMSLPEGATPLAEAYAGHQFGYFSILGDGRAMLLGEQVAPSGKRYDLHLKGSGRTPYARGGDGRATLPAMLREYLISEAMHALGVPTTRSLSVVTTGDVVQRETALPGAVLMRIASSHLRVGTFQFAALAGSGDVQRVADYAIARHYAYLHEESEAKGANIYRLFLREVVARQARLVAHWMSIGFIHGVMNTDNITISGETIDYGPCAFMDAYDPTQVFSSIDREGRYRYDRQPAMALWGLTRLAESLVDLLGKTRDEAVGVAVEVLAEFDAIYTEAWQEAMRRKIGLGRAHEADSALIHDLLALMEAYHADFTNTFVRLTLEASGKSADYLEGTANLWASDAFASWRTRWSVMLSEEDKPLDVLAEMMQGANPFVLARNHRVEEVLAQAVAGDMAPFGELLETLSTPYRYDEALRPYQALPQEDMSHYRTYCGT